MVMPGEMLHCGCGISLIPADKPHCSENVCALVVLELKEVGL